MNKNILKYGLFLMLFSLAFAGLAITVSNFYHPQQNRGRLVFPNTVEEGLDLNKIIITGAEGRISLRLESNYWVVGEADFYYAGLERLNDLFNNLNNATYYHQQPFSEKALLEDRLADPGRNRNKEEAGVLVETFNNDKPLEKIIIGKSVSSGAYSFARPAGKDEIWLIDGRYDLPQEPSAWLMQPILNYPPEITEKIFIQDAASQQSASRQTRYLPFVNHEKNIVKPDVLLEKLDFLIAGDVLSAQNFDENLYPKRRTIRLTTFSGLITTINLFHDDQDFWIYIKLSTTNLPTAAVNAYIKDNSFLYDGWFFKISAAAGRTLANYQLI